MIDVIRVKIRGEMKRFPMFTTRDHLNFLLTSADMESKGPIEQQTILDELLDILYPGYSKTEQEYIFSRVYVSSFGKNVIKVEVTENRQRVQTFMVINDNELSNEYQVDETTTLGFRFPVKRCVDESLFLECIDYVIFEGVRHEWSALDEESKTDILDIISMDDVKNIIEMLTSSCDVKIKERKLTSLIHLFKIIFSKSDLSEFYRTNFLLNKNNLDVDFIMGATPMERSIYITLLAEDLKEK